MSGATSVSASSKPAGSFNRWITARAPVFRHSNYRKYFGGQLISVVGTWMAQIAQAWLVLTLTDSPMLLGLVPVFQFGPSVLFGLWGGLVADRFPKRQIMISTQIASSILQFSLAALILSGHIALWHVFAIASLLGVVQAFDTPARQAFASELVPRDQLIQAVSLNSAVFNAGRLVGPALGGLILALVGSGWCFVINGLTFFAVIVQLMRMDESKLFSPLGRRTGGNTREGIDFMRGNPTIMLIVLMMAFVSTFSMAYSVWMPLLARDVLDRGAGGFGILMSALGFGAMTGGLALAFAGSRRPSSAMIPLTAGLLGASGIVIGTAGFISAPLLAFMFILPVAGFMQTFTASLSNSSVQMLAPDELRGRVLSIYFMVFNSGLPLGALIAGATSEWFGMPGSIMFGGSIALAAAVSVAYLGRVMQKRSTATPNVEVLAEQSAD
ncbi:MAG: MFS transporter [Thermomicrobiales bacterium]|nr:MFS transporter [Thermomicrobiales bacterium]